MHGMGSYLRLFLAEFMHGSKAKRLYLAIVAGDKIGRRRYVVLEFHPQTPMGNHKAWLPAVAFSDHFE
jgi:hypothetical protein